MKSPLPQSGGSIDIMVMVSRMKLLVGNGWFLRLSATRGWDARAS